MMRGRENLFVFVVLSLNIHPALVIRKERMNREIEADGFITREADTTQNTKSCISCKWYQYSIIVKSYVCVEGHTIDAYDWRRKYDCCDRWEK